MVSLFKKIFLLFLVLLLSSAVSATVFLHEPVEGKVSANDSIQLGKIAPGQSFTLTIEKKSEKGEKWDTLSIDDSLLPESWAYDVRVSGETISAEISVPRNAKIGSQRLTLTASNSAQPEFADAFFAEIAVAKPESVFQAGIDATSVEAKVNSIVSGSITLSNNSVGDAVFLLSSSLPNQWMQAQWFAVKAKATATLPFAISPKAYGKRAAVLTLSSNQNYFSESFDFEINVFPTLRGKFEAGFFGIPFFSLSLWPYYLINALLSLL